MNTVLPETTPALRDRVAETLTDAIVEGALAPGDALRERAVSEELGVSRVPVREALLVLEAQRLVVMEPRAGARVTAFTRQDVRDLFDMREALEPLAARRAGERRDADAIAVLEAHVAAARAAQEAGDDAAGSRANAAFHLALVDAAGSPLLSASAAPLACQLRRLFRRTITCREEMMGSAHREVLDAVRAGDAHLAGLAARLHVVATREPSLALFEPRT